MAATLVDNVRVNVTSMGTGALVLGSAVDGYRGVEALQNGKTYNYKVVAGSQWEIGQGQYLTSGSQLVRAPIYSSNGDGLVDLPQNAQVSFVALSSDFNGTGLSQDAIEARDQAVAAAAAAQDASAAALAIVEPVAAIPTDAGAGVVGTAGGGTVQDFINNLLSSVGASIVGFIQGGTGAVLRKVQDKLREIEISVKDFGAVGTALADDTSAIQKTIDYAASLVAAAPNRGAVVVVPPGQYLVSGTLTITSSRIAIRGAGSFHSQIVRNTNYGPTIKVQSHTAGTLNLLERIEISGLSLYHDVGPAVAMVDDHIRMVGVTHGRLLDLDIDNGAYGISLYGCVDTEIRSADIIGSFTTGANNSVAGLSLYHLATNPDGYAVGSLVTLPTQVSVSDCEIFGPLNTGWKYGVLINAAEDITFSNCYLGNAKFYNAYIQQTAHNDMILEVAFSNGTYIDGSGADSVRIDGSLGNGSGYIGTVSFNGCDIKGQGGQTPGNGIFVDGTARGGAYSQACRNLRINGCRIGDYNNNGIWIVGCVNAVIDGNQIAGNNYNNSAGGRGILIGAAANRVAITGGRIGGLPEGNGTSLQTYGIELVAGATEIMIDGVDVRGNTTGGILDGTATPTTSPPTKRITNCPGFRDGAAVPGSPTVPASTVTQYNPFGSPCWLSIFSGTVSDIKLNGQTVASATGWQGYVGPDSRVTITYTVAPSWVWWPQ